MERDNDWYNMYMPERKSKLEEVKSFEDNELEVDVPDEMFISVDAMKKIYSYAEAVETEIAGLLIVDTTDGIPIIKDALLFEQEATHGDVELDIDTVSKEAAKLGKENPAKLEMLKGWWHSHANMDVFWSGTDDHCFENFSTIAPIVYGVVVNKRGECKARIDIKTELGSIKIKNIKLTPLVDEFDEACMKEARAKIKKKKFSARIKHAVKKVVKYIRGD